MKKIIEKWAVKTLYDLEFQRFARINKKTRKIIFNWQGRILFSIFPSRKERLAVTILTRLYGYTCWEDQLCLLLPLKKQISHSWGEIQDIIRDANKRGIKPRLSELSSESPLIE